MWTQFCDMHSGGNLKEKWSQIFIEAPESEAVVIFCKRFGHDPNHVTCPCCGEDYAIYEYRTLAQATAYERRCQWKADKKKKSGGSYIEKRNTDVDKFCDKNEPRQHIKATPHIPLCQYVKQKDVLVIYAKNIKAKERIG